MSTREQEFTDITHIAAGISDQTRRELDASNISLEQLKVVLDTPVQNFVAERFFHEGLGGYIDVVKMDLSGYAATEPDAYLSRTPDGRPTTSDMVPNIDEINFINRAKVYIMHGTLFCGKSPDQKMAYDMAGRRGWGAYNLALIQCIDKWNPRYGSRLDLFTVILARQNALAITLDYFIEHQMIPQLAEQLGPAHNCVLGMMRLRDWVRATCRVRETAQSLGIDFETALQGMAQRIEQKAEQRTATQQGV